MADPITNYYPQNPWEGVDTKERTPWYYPQLYDEYRRRTIYNRFVSVSFNHNGPHATELVISSQPGQGTTLTATVPLVHEELAHAR